MRLKYWLAKLGILRWGIKKARYKSGRDMPIEFIKGDVYNKKRDIMFDLDKGKKRKKK